MKPDAFEAQVRELEWFHGMRFPPGSWVILRLDGRCFSRLTEGRFEKPFDARFHDLMTATARALFEGFQGLYAFTESDEISLLLPRDWALFDRELEKVVSLSAGLASATFSLALGAPVCFDSRACVAAQDGQVIDYFRWRQADAGRCALNGWCYWTLRKAGRSVAAATEALRGKATAFKNEMLFRAGVNFNDLPAWQRRGVGLYRRSFRREGRDPRLGRAVSVTRRRVHLDRDLPFGDAYAAHLGRVLREGVLPDDGPAGR